jgi:hypothetical protein
MTRKDYQMIADAIKGSQVHYQFTEGSESANNAAVYRNGVANVAGTLAYLFSLDNPRFDRAKFLAACGLSDN